MSDRSQCYGISDEELLCDEGSAVAVSIGVNDKFRESFYKGLYNSHEESSVRSRLEEFIGQRNEYRNATILNVTSYIETKIADAQQHYSNDRSPLVRQEKFSKLSGFLEALSKEASGIKIENNEATELPTNIDVEKRNIGRQTVVNESTVITGQIMPSSFHFQPAKFSTPKQNMSETSLSLLLPSMIGAATITISSSRALQHSALQTSTYNINRNGHLILKRTDSNAEGLTRCCSAISSSEISNGSGPSLNNNNKKLETPVTSSQTYKKCDEIDTIVNAISGKNITTDITLLEKPVTKCEVKCLESVETKLADPIGDDSYKVKKIRWLKQLPFFEFLETDDLSEVYVTEFDKRPKDVLHSLAKRSVKEKVACWTRKNATKEVIKNAVEYFSDLLTGKTVYGFDGKMLNFNGDEPGKRFSMASIVNSYVGVVQKDEHLAECAAVVLLSLMIRIKEFKSMLFNKLFSASPLLCMDKEECIREIGELNNSDDAAVSEAVNTWCNNQSTIIKLFVLLHCPTTRNNAVVSSDMHCSSTTLWSLLAVAVMQETPFSCALVTEILKFAGGYLRRLYGVQFRKLLEFLSHKTLKKWSSWLKNDASICSLTKMALNYYVSVLQLELKELSV